MEIVILVVVVGNLFFIIMVFFMVGKVWFVCIKILVIFWWLEVCSGRWFSLLKMWVI